MIKNRRSGFRPTIWAGISLRLPQGGWGLVAPSSPGSGTVSGGYREVSTIGRNREWRRLRRRRGDILEFGAS